MATTHLERGWINRPMRDRLRAAVDRLQLMEDFEQPAGSLWSLRSEQINVFTDFVSYLERSLTSRVGFGRIILPPRTGKTVIAGQFICASGLTTLYLVPTRPLLEQVRQEFVRQVPGLALGVYYSEEKSLVEHGVNIMTYQSFVELFKAGALPLCVRRSALVFADEGHRAMTELRLQALRESFDPLTRVVALTATPDYSEKRQLQQYYPEDIHQITLPEALKMGLLAKYQKIHIHEIDLHAEHIRLVGGELDQRELGALLSGVAMFEFVLRLRYEHQEERSRGCLIACSSREQALALTKYLKKNRPADAPPPGLVLQDTKRADREQMLADFDDGRIDTLVQIGILTEGWSAVRCKLLIDIAPSISEVRATQKMFRPLTKWEGQQAVMHLVLPKGLTRRPILPDAMLLEQRSSVFDWLHPAKKHTHCPPQEKIERVRKIEGVQIRTRLLMEVLAMTAPKLDANDDDLIREVLESADGFDPCSPPAFNEFMSVVFKRPVFRGTGYALLKYLNIAHTPVAYRGLLLRLYLRQLPESTLRRYHEQAEHVSCSDDVRVMTELMWRYNKQNRPQLDDFSDGWRAMFGPDPNRSPSLEGGISSRDRNEQVRRMLRMLPPSREIAIRLHYGIGAFYSPTAVDHTMSEIAEIFDFSRTRSTQLHDSALRMLRGRWKAIFLNVLPYLELPE